MFIFLTWAGMCFFDVSQLLFSLNQCGWAQKKKHAHTKCQKKKKKKKTMLEHAVLDPCKHEHAHIITPTVLGTPLIMLFPTSVGQKIDTHTHTHTHTHTQSRGVDDTMVVCGSRCWWCVVILFALCLLLLTWSIAGIASHACHSSDTFFHCDTCTHTHNACLCFTMELVGECLKCLFRLTRGVPALVV